MTSPLFTENEAASLLMKLKSIIEENQLVYDLLDLSKSSKPTKKCNHCSSVNLKWYKDQLNAGKYVCYKCHKLQDLDFEKES